METLWKCNDNVLSSSHTEIHSRRAFISPGSWIGTSLNNFHWRPGRPTLDCHRRTYLNLWQDSNNQYRICYDHFTWRSLHSMCRQKESFIDSTPIWKQELYWCFQCDKPKFEFNILYLWLYTRILQGDYFYLINLFECNDSKTEGVTPNSDVTIKNC